jgi:hypothetical protein
MLQQTRSILPNAIFFRFSNAANLQPPRGKSMNQSIRVNCFQWSIKRPWVTSLPIIGTTRRTRLNEWLRNSLVAFIVRRRRTLNSYRYFQIHFTGLRRAITCHRPTLFPATTDGLQWVYVQWQGRWPEQVCLRKYRNTSCWSCSENHHCTTNEPPSHQYSRPKSSICLHLSRNNETIIISPL